MKLVRRGTFETNSSSTHALVIPHKVEDNNYNLSDSLDHNYVYGREESRLVEEWDEKLAYLYIAIKELSDWDSCNYKITKEMIENFKNRINIIYNDVYKIVEYKPWEGDPKPNDIFNYIDSDGKEDLVKDSICIINDSWWTPFVDHCGELAEGDLFDKVFNDDEFLKRFIFNKESYITIGGDEYRGYNIKTIGFQYDYEENCINFGTEDNPEYKDVGEFWDKLKEYEKDNDVFLKGN